MNHVDSNNFGCVVLAFIVCLTVVVLLVGGPVGRAYVESLEFAACVEACGSRGVARAGEDWKGERTCVCGVSSAPAGEE